VRSGDVREGGWSDTWSDRRQQDRSSGAQEGRVERQRTAPAPPLPDTIAASALDAAARRDLGGLQKDLAEAVARHLVAAGTLVDEDPAAALAHARYARRRASRIAIVREAAGITAYHAGEWAEALAELRAARRMGGGPGHLAVMADIERAMGRPERAIELARGPEARDLARSAQIELAIVVAGARRDLGELDASVVALQIPELEASRRDPWSARLFYAYADNLLAAGRESDALQWFVHAADADTDGQTDADVRIAGLTGEPLADDGIEFALDEEEPGDEPTGTMDGEESAEEDEADIADVGPDTEADDVACDEQAASATPSGSVPAEKGDDAAASATASESVPGEKGDEAAASATASGSVPAEKGDEAAASATASGSVPAEKGDDAAASATPSESAPAEKADVHVNGAHQACASAGAAAPATAPEDNAPAPKGGTESR
jgi:tetratricopeptide (TPR) repeat protein